MRDTISRRELLSWTLAAAAGSRLGASAAPARLLATASPQFDGVKIKSATLKFIEKCARDDGGYSPSPDPQYPGSSDTGESDLAAVTYAATLARTVGWKLPHPERSAEFIQRHQQPSGVFINFQGKLDPKEDLAVLYKHHSGSGKPAGTGGKTKV